MRAAVYCPLEFRELVETAIGVPAQFHEKWPAFEKAIRGADCALAVLEKLDAAPGATELRKLRLAHPETDLVLVTRFSRENAGLLPDTAVRVVWLEDVGERLNPEVEEAARGLCVRMVRFVRTHLMDSGNGRMGMIGDALLVLLQADPPLRTVKEWCRAVSCSVSTMDKRFAKAFRSGTTPLFVLDAVRLYRALDEFPDARSWTRLAGNAASRWYEDGRLSPETLSDTAARLLGKVRVPKEILRNPDESGQPARWDPPLAEKPVDVDRRVLFEGLVALLR